MSPQTPPAGHSPATPPQNDTPPQRKRGRRGAPLIIGALGLAALGVTQLLPVRYSAETDLRLRSLNALETAGLTGITVDFTGQDGVLAGTVTSAADAERALTIVRGLEGVRVAASRLTITVPASPSSAVVPSGQPTGTAAVPVPVATPTAGPTPTTATPTSPPTPAPTTPDPRTRAAVQARLAALPPLRFAFDSPQLSPAGRASAARAAAALKAAPDLRIRVDGYTDHVGAWDVNLALSRRRAETVRQVLIANGIPAKQVTAVGWSEDRPKVPNTSAANRAINRRVEIVVS